VQDKPYLKKDTSPWYGSWSVSKFYEQSSEDQDAYLKKYWPDVEEKVEVQDILKAASGQGLGTGTYLLFCFYGAMRLILTLHN